jgi:hypothetical protein
MGGPNVRRRQPTPCFMDRDDMVSLSRARSQRRKAWIEAEIPRLANLTVICDPQPYLPNPYYVEDEGDF